MGTRDLTEVPVSSQAITEVFEQVLRQGRALVEAHRRPITRTAWLSVEATLSGQPFGMRANIGLDSQALFSLVPDCRTTGTKMSVRCAKKNVELG